MSSKSAVELRAMQSRAFDTSDRQKSFRTVIATLQDLGYSVDKVEPNATTVTATKLAALRLTATVYPRSASQVIVRANAMVTLANTNNQVDEPAFYQQFFFEPLSKALFLTALQVQDGDLVKTDTPPEPIAYPSVPSGRPPTPSSQPSANPAAEPAVRTLAPTPPPPSPARPSHPVPTNLNPPNCSNCRND